MMFGRVERGRLNQQSAKDRHHFWQQWREAFFSSPCFPSSLIDSDAACWNRLGNWAQPEGSTRKMGVCGRMAPMIGKNRFATARIWLKLSSFKDSTCLPQSLERIWPISLFSLRLNIRDDLWRRAIAIEAISMIGSARAMVLSSASSASLVSAKTWWKDSLSESASLYNARSALAWSGWAKRASLQWPEPAAWGYVHCCRRLWLGRDEAFSLDSLQIFFTIPFRGTRSPSRMLRTWKSAFDHQKTGLIGRKRQIWWSADSLIVR
jgi:hypothetical protein